MIQTGVEKFWRQPMKALMKTAPGNGNLAIVDVPVPECGPDQVLVEVAYCGVCGTDREFHEGHFPGMTWPLTLGHEIAGTIADVRSMER